MKLTKLGITGATSEAAKREKSAAPANKTESMEHILTKYDHPTTRKNGHSPVIHGPSTISPGQPLIWESSSVATA
jgi:hypothetical protein